MSLELFGIKKPLRGKLNNILKDVYISTSTITQKIEEDELEIDGDVLIVEGKYVAFKAFTLDATFVDYRYAYCGLTFVYHKLEIFLDRSITEMQKNICDKAIAIIDLNSTQENA